MIWGATDLRRRLSATAIGTLGLTLGALIYLRYRPPTVLSTAFGADPAYLPSPLGTLTDVLPSFLHTLSFTLLTVACTRWGAKSRWVAVGFWFFTNVCFEIVQHDRIADLLARMEPLSLLHGFGRQGTFDVLDLIAITAASLLSCLIVRGHRVFPSQHIVRRTHYG